MKLDEKSMQEATARLVAKMFPADQAKNDRDVVLLLAKSRGDKLRQRTLFTARPISLR